MNNKTRTSDFLKGASVHDALAKFDSLPPIPAAFMLGRWIGWEIKTGNPIEGLLEAMNWYGKEFINENEVQPLLVSGVNGETFPIAPTPLILGLALRFPLIKQPAMKSLNRLAILSMRTRRTQARLRMVDYRGVGSATMIYDHVPIHDHFRKVDDKTVLGIMDYKLVDQPYFFMLQREA